ncbi:hypothetical protein K474DRAFT_1572399, partial [Panus rudis PR-1116 ss-1]
DPPESDYSNSSPAHQSYSRRAILSSSTAAETRHKVYARQATPTAEGVTKVFRNRMYRTEKRPEYTPELYCCLEAYVEVNGVRAFALFDSGSTFDSMTPGFATQIKANLITLANPIRVQLAVKGSHTALNNGTFARCRVGPIDVQHYFDISNIDHYDLVLGMPFLTTHDVSLQCKERRIVFGDQYSIPALLEGSRI